MKEHPILFSTDMVRAILKGRKTQTRRPIELGPYSPDYYAVYKLRYKVGDILWVRETWNLADPDGESALPGELYGPYAPFTGSKDNRKINWRAIYRASALSEKHPKYGNALWKPSIHMPKWACRLFLEVDDVGIHRLQDISEDEAKAEGMKSIIDFHSTWNKLYSTLQYRWERNPWVYYTKFHVLEIKNTLQEKA